MRNDRIQVLRGIAIIAVVLIHTCPPGLWQVICKPFMNFAVALFIFLSGYLTVLDSQDWPGFYKKRLSRVLVPYVLWTVVYTLPEISPGRLAANLLTAGSATQMYYILVYVQFVLLTPLLAKLLKSNPGRIICWTIAPLSVILFKYVPLISGLPLEKHVASLWNVSCLGWFSYYCLGLVLGNNVKEAKCGTGLLCGLLAVSVLVQMAEGYLWYLMGNAGCGTQLKLSAMLTSSLCLLLAFKYIVSGGIVRIPCLQKMNGTPKAGLNGAQKVRYKTLGRYFKVAGDYSFGIYLSHMMIMQLFGKLSLYQLLPFPVNSIIIFLSTLIFVYLLSLILPRSFIRLAGLR